MTAPLKVLAAVIIMALCAAGYWFMDYQSTLNELTQLRTQLTQSQAKLAENQDKLRRLPELTRRESELERELASLLQGPVGQADDPEAFVSRTLSSLEHLVLAEQARSGDMDFCIQSVAPRAETPASEEEGTRLPGRVFELRLRGRYQTLADFLVQLSTLKLDRPVTINRIDLAPSNNGPVLDISLPMTAYLRMGG